MSQANLRQRTGRVRTHEGGSAQTGSVVHQLRRTVTSCLLWESTFYESGEDIATRIHTLANKCPANFVAELAVEVRKQHGLRHAPLWLILSLLPRKDILGNAKAEAITNVISRCDELTEIIAMYWASDAHEGKEGVVPNALKTGVAKAFEKFDEYQFGKYRGEGKSVTLRDAMFLTHPKPSSEEREQLYKRIADDALQTPDTWEVGLSTGGDKKETFTRLLKQEKLGYLATLRNIRNMVEAGVSKGLIKDRLNSSKGRKGVLPFQFISAAIMVPGFEQELDNAMIACLEDMEMFPGKTCILVDTSGSMTSTISDRSILHQAWQSWHVNCATT
jgi:60 kDa SS-A/Ro ribonucleoprotein